MRNSQYVRDVRIKPIGETADELDIFSWEIEIAVPSKTLEDGTVVRHECWLEHGAAVGFVNAHADMVRYIESI